MMKGTAVLNAFSLAFAFSDTLGMILWSIFKQAENKHSKQGEDVLSGSCQVRCSGSNKVSLVPRAVKLLPSGQLLCPLSGKEVTLSLYLRSAAGWRQARELERLKFWSWSQPYSKERLHLCFLPKKKVKFCLRDIFL